MSLRSDERAVTVQIGAVLLLAIIFAALALYQVNVVPAENGAVESEHNQQVHGEMQELRNAVKNAGTKGDSTSVSVTLGTRYPSRTFLTNPPNPTGTLETTETRTLGIENASVSGEYDGESAPNGLIGNHSTRALRYQPAYNEYRDAPTTTIEHAFAYNEFDTAQIALTEQPLIDGDRITIVLLEGELSKSSSGTITVDTRVVDGPTEAVTIQSTDGSITIPTRSPDIWNESIASEPNATVDSFDDGRLEIDLVDGTYKLQMARIGVGDASKPANERFDVRASDTGETGSSDGTPAYPVSWENPSDQAGVEDCNWDEKSCTITGNSVDLTMGTDNATDGASVAYAVSDRSVGTVSPTEGVTGSDGTHTTTVSVDANAEDGETVTVYTSSGSDGDKIVLEISRNGPALESASGQEVTYKKNNGLQKAGFNWTLSERGDIALRIYDREGGTVVGSKTVTNAATDDSENISVTAGSNNGGKAEPYPVWLEIEVLETGDVCGAQLRQSDETIDLCN